LVEKEKNNANVLLEKLQNTYELAVNTGLAGSFDKRRKRIEDGFVTQWRKNFFISLTSLGVIAAAILVISIFKDGFTVSDLVFFRLSLLTPLIFYTGYAAVQYSKERALLEKYAFKATVASSLGSYTELLIKQFPDVDNEIVNFVISSMFGIYTEPHEQVKTRSYRLGFKKISYAEFKEELKHDIDDAVIKAISKTADVDT
jgi:tRNA 2-selenouridine synthase SelU